MPIKIMPMCVLLLPFLCAACNNRGQTPDSTGSAPNKGPDRAAVPQSPSILPPANPASIPRPQPGIVPTKKDPAAEWAREAAKRLESRRLVTVNPRKRLVAFTRTPGAGDTGKEWQLALNQVTGQQVQFFAITQFLAQLNPLWKGEEFLPAESQKYLARIKQLSKEGVGTWRDALKSVTVDFADDVNAAITLIQMDYLYESEQFRAARATQLLPRVRSLSPELLRPWADALECNTLEATVELIDQDWLFENDRLKANASEQALQVMRAAHPVPK